MPDYRNGKIYAILSDKNTKQVYVGSTTSPINLRLSKHKAAYKQHLKNNYPYCASFDLIKKGDVRIKLLENYACNSRAELQKREQNWVEKKRVMQRRIINQRPASRSSK